jgi:hypothetical protein
MLLADLIVHLPRTMIVCVFDNKVSSSRLYIEERIGISGSFILTAIISCSIQEDKYGWFYKEINVYTRNPSFINIFIKK